MRRSAIVLMILLLFSLPMLYIAPNPTPNQTTKTTTTTITTQRAGGTNYTVSLLTNQNFTGIGSDYLQNWTYDEWGNNPEAADGSYSTSNYYNPPASAYLRLRYNNRQSELGWTQPFTYSGTTPVVSALLTFWWRCTSYSYAGSTNYVEIWLESPVGIRTQVGHWHFYSTTAWASPPPVDISNILNMYGAGTYMFEADAYLTTGYNYQSTPQVTVRYDYVNIAVKYTVIDPPSALTVTINNNAAYTNNRTVTLSLAASGADKMYLSNTSTLPPHPTWEPFSTTKKVSLTLGDGTKNIYFWANNTAGVTGPTSDSIIYDFSQPPAPNLVSPTNGTAIKNNAPTFAWSSVTDAGPSGLANYTFECSQDKTFSSGNTTVPGLTGTSYTPSQLADGNLYWHVRAVDNAGNRGSWSSPYRLVIVDTHYPNPPTLSSPTSGTVTRNNKPTFTWNSASDPSPSSTITNHTLQYSKDPNFSSGVTTVNVTMPTLSYTVPSGSPLSDGTWYWRVRATDKAGNIGSYSSYWSIVVDTTPPSQPTLVSPNDNAKTSDNTPSFTWGAATDATSGVDYYTLQFDNTQLFNSPNMRNVTGLGLNYTIPSALADGTWYWRVNATDRVGNQGSYSSYRSIVIDTVAPNPPALSSPINGALIDDNTPTFTWLAASDPAPSSGIADYTLQLDTNPSFNSVDLRTVSGLTGTSYTVVSPLGDGTWYWHVRATDNAGKTGNYNSPHWSIVINTAVTGAPALVAPINGLLTRNNTQTFSWSNVGATTYDLYIDKSPQFNTGDLIAFLGLPNTSKVVRNLIDGSLYWKVIAQPGGKNSSTRGIMVDTVAPNPPALSSPINGARTNVTRPLLVWNPTTDLTSGVSSYALQYSQNPAFSTGVATVPGLTGTSYSIPNPLSAGTWYWRINATDNAGNSGSYSGNWNFVVDTQPPTGLSLSLGGDYTKTLTITLTIAATGADTMYLSNDGSNWMNYTFAASMQWNLTAGDGTKQVYFRCKDAAGNWAYLSPLYRTVTLDTVPPTAGSPQVPVSGSVTSNNMTSFQWSAGSDGSGSGIASYSLQLDTTTTFSSANLTTISGLAGTSYALITALKDGTWYWRISATDRAGNTGFFSTYYVLIISTIPPGKVASLVLPKNNSLLNLVSPQFTWTPTNADRYHIQIDRYLNFSSSYLIENQNLNSSRFSPSVDNNETLTDGTWYWRVEGISVSGAPSGYLIVGGLTIDVTPPSNPEPLSPPDQGATNVTNQTSFHWSLVPDAVSYWIQLDSTLNFNSTELETFTNITTTIFITINDPPLDYGFWYWRVVPLDAANNTGDLSDAQINKFIVDTINPNPPTPRSPQQGVVTNQITPTLVWYAAGDPAFGVIPGSGVVNYSLWLDNSSSFNSGNLRNITGLTGLSCTVASPLSDGTWYWLVNATDKAGNTGQGSIIQSFAIDTHGPVPPLILSMSPNGVSVDVSKVTLRWGASSDPSGVSGYYIQIDVSRGFDSSGRYNYYSSGSGNTFATPDELPNGQWYWRIAAVDGAGNQGPWSEPVPFVVDVVVGLSPMMVIMLGGGSSGVAVLAVLGFVLYRRAKIPFVIKKLDQSIKLISRGEMPQLVPMRTRSQVIASIYRDKLAILSKEKLEKAEEKKKKVSKEAELGAEKLAQQTMPKGAEAPAKAVAEESDVDLVAKELEKLEGEGGKSADESEMIKREIDELEKGSKKKKDGSD